ncbi:uncharacterized protein A4U43_C05F23490 [Asparagus officinalis]|uniref:Splicing factor 3B subunit 1 domain-containing protein n=1 Tax=Asparagus officinalis TaxID=4686 RepID=A0A5P1EZA4_ASPOF|nr:uncharacterized protein A4U43_C05F23490 [Asparagus officinalis]
MVTGPKSLKELPRAGAEADDDSGFKKPSRIIDREDDYRRRRLNRIISPDRNDPFATGEKTPDPSVRTYADVMREEALKRQKEDLLKEIAKKKEDEKNNKEAAAAAPEPAPQKRRNRWDQSQGGEDPSSKKAKTSSDWDVPDSTPGIGSGRWDATPTPGRVAGDATPGVCPSQPLG